MNDLMITVHLRITSQATLSRCLSNKVLPYCLVRRDEIANEGSSLVPIHLRLKPVCHHSVQSIAYTSILSSMCLCHVCKCSDTIHSLVQAKQSIASLVISLVLACCDVTGDQ